MLAVAAAFASDATGQSAGFVFVDGFEEPPDCSAELSCAVPAAGKTCLSGRLFEVENDRPLRAFVEPGRTCTTGALGGPCDLRLTAYDAISFAQDPLSAAPLAIGETLVDGCGRYRLANVDPPTFGQTMLVLDDEPGKDDASVISTRTTAIAANQRIDAFDHFAIDRTVDTAWTLLAGASFGGSFAGVGSILLLYVSSATPVAGVTVNRNGDASGPVTRYFSDTQASSRFAVSASAISTGANGAALVAKGGTATYTGAGGAVGCTWPVVSNINVPGTIAIAILDCNP